MEIIPIAKLEGKKAKRIYYGENGNCLQEAKTSENYVKEIVFTNTYHGEYDICWFVVFENGKETSRHNAKFIETIEWE
jgi:hypothetical protein